MDWNGTSGVPSDQPGVRQAPTDGPPYEPPTLTVLGTVSELTEGVVPVTTDGLGPGSAF